MPNLELNVESVTAKLLRLLSLLQYLLPIVLLHVRRTRSTLSLDRLNYLEAAFAGLTRLQPGDGTLLLLAFICILLPTATLTKVNDVLFMCWMYLRRVHGRR